MIEKIFNKINEYKLKKLINDCIKCGQIEYALELAQDYNFLKKEFEIYDILKKKKITSKKIVQRLEKIGELKNALEFANINPRITNSESIKRIKHDLVSNNSKNISEEIFLNSGKCFWKEVYYAKENNDYSNMIERVIEYNLIQMDNPLLNYLYPRYIMN